jgi:antitoxin HigA-1
VARIQGRVTIDRRGHEVFAVLGKHVPIEGYVVYVLKDPRDGSVRYVGSTMRLTVRKSQHLLGNSSPKSVQSWITELRAAGTEPVMVEIDSARNRSHAYRKERDSIDRLLAEGANLLNLPNRRKHSVSRSPTTAVRALLHALGLSPKELAARLRVRSHVFVSIVRGTRPITTTVAMKLGRLTGTPARYWIDLQTEHDLRRLSSTISLRLVEPLDAPLIENVRAALGQIETP